MKHQDLTSASHDGSTTMVEMSSMSSAGPATRCPGASWSSVHTGVSCRPPSSKYADVRTLGSGRGPAALQGGHRGLLLCTVDLHVGRLQADVSVQLGSAGMRSQWGAQGYAVVSVLHRTGVELRVRSMPCFETRCPCSICHEPAPCS